MSLWTLDTRVVSGREGYPTGTLLYSCTFYNCWKYCGWSKYFAMEFSFCISSLPCVNTPPGVTISDTRFHFELLHLIRSPLSSTAMVDLVFSNSPKPYFIALLNCWISELPCSVSSEKTLPPWWQHSRCRWRKFLHSLGDKNDNLPWGYPLKFQHYTLNHASFYSTSAWVLQYADRSHG